jgi:serine/threonine-protein kinase
MGYEVGSRVGDYEVLQVLGAGGMGCVYKVRNVISDRVEAMKVLLPDLERDPDLANRFMREIKVQASLVHPNIAALHTALRIDNQLLMLMEYVEGVTLENRMESGPVPIDQAVDYIAQVLSALAYAHGHGVVHRDIKPANMMITSGGMVKLMDFGIAKMTADRKLTQTGRTVGSLYYMSPEQIRGALDLDPRSDLYSLGVSLYELVTGARPFQGDSEYSIMAAHLQTNPPPPIQISPNLPPALSEIILLALEKDPAKRFQTADAFRSALLSVCPSRQAAAQTPAPVSAPIVVTQPPPVAVALPPPRAARSRRGLWIAVGSLATIAVLVIIATQLPRFRHTAAESPAIQTAPASPAPSAVGSQAPMSNPVTEPEAARPASQSEVTAAPRQNVMPRKESPAATSAATARSPHREVLPNATQTTSQPAAQQQQPTRPPVSQPAQTAPAQPTQPPGADAKAAEQLSEIRDQFNLLGVRIGTVKSSLENLRRQQAASGLGLRGDMADAAQRMDLYFAETEKALNRGDAQAAKRNLDLAEREVSKLEKFLGK